MFEAMPAGLAPSVAGLQPMIHNRVAALESSAVPEWGSLGSQSFEQANRGHRCRLGGDVLLQLLRRPPVHRVREHRRRPVSDSFGVTRTGSRLMPSPRA